MLTFLLVRLLGRRASRPASWNWSIPGQNPEADWLYRQVPRSGDFSGSLVFSTKTGKHGDVVSMERYADDTRGIFILWDGDEEPTHYGEWDEALAVIRPMSHP